MNEITAYMTTQNRLWYSANSLITMFGKDGLNKLWKSGKIEIREGINGKVIRLK